MPLLRTGDFLYSLRFLRLLTMPWEKTAAFKQGIVDEKGKKLKKPETPAEKSAYTSFHRLVFNIKRLITKMPGIAGKLGSYAAALYLIKEHAKINDKKLIKVINEAVDIDISILSLQEDSQWFLTDNNKIQANIYTLTRDMPLKNGELLAKKNTKVVVEEHEPVGDVIGIRIYEGKHVKTGQSIYITQNDITY